jgi:sec-independent protein translocase protein TatC
MEHSEARSVAEHIGDLRIKIFIAFGAALLGAILTHVFHTEIIAFLLRPAGTQEFIFLSPLEPFLFILKIDIVGGIVIAFPIIVWCIFSFIAPALPQRIKKILISFYLTSFVLLLIGLLYAFFVTIPLTLKFLFSITIAGIHNQISAQSYIGFFLTQALIIAGIFQVPILIIGGTYLGIIKTALFKNKRRYIYLIVTIALAVITPTTDIFSLTIVLIPCLVIFEVSLVGAKIVERLRKKNL